MDTGCTQNRTRDGATGAGVQEISGRCEALRVEPFSGVGLVVKILGPLWNAVRSPFDRWRYGDTFKRFKTFVRSVPPEPWIADIGWTAEMHAMAEDGVTLGNLLQHPRHHFTPDPTKLDTHVLATGYRQKSDRFLFEDWLRVYRRRKQVEKDSYVKPSDARPSLAAPQLPSHEMVVFGQFRQIVTPFPTDRLIPKHDTWTPVYVHVIEDAVKLGYLVEEEIQVQANMSKPTLEDLRIGNRPMRPAYRRTDKEIMFEEWVAFQRQRRQ